jgi:type I restriction-modification system DNA methylase subunit
MSTFETAHASICALIDDFAAHRTTYMDPAYSEAQARLSFIDKFWIALGWDVRHERQKNPYEQEVRVERTVTVGGAQKRADYAFFVGNYSQPLFFVEAKKPFATLDALDNCFQLVRYAWNAGCHLSVLHDFEELLVLDCRWRPDKATAQSRIWKRFHYTDFKDEAKLRELYHLFSRESAGEGAIAKRAAELPKPKGKSVQRELFKLQSQTLDEAFLSELEEWREDLAKGFKRDNEDLDSETLTEITQRTLDRLVFLRFLEDKGIEQQTTVGKLGGRSGSSWTDFRAAGRRLDSIYNGAIFRRHPILDSETFALSDDVFGGICKKLDAANSPYDFNVIPIHILGSIYERFLGSVIIATDKRAKVELKPEVRKAGGVYYTPEYIVHYIVAQTVGRQIAGKTPDQIEKMSFADIACGSGSFLLGVFDCLLRYHTKWFNEHPDKAALPKPVKITKKGLPHKQRREVAGDCYQDPDTGSLRLTLEKKRQMLLNNVFGTDLDAQAVEVAQLSLYLKLLEDETAGTTHQYSLDFDREALLPSLESNIVCGNALIGTDISGLFSLPPEEEEKLRPMDFETTFPEVFERGGFDAIVGNPPYVRQESLKEVKPYLEKRFESFSGTADLYSYFMENGVKRLRPGGRYSIIVSSSFMRANYGEPLRRTLKQHAAVERIVDFGGLAVFADAKDTYVCIPILSRAPQPERVEVCKVATLDPEVVEDEMLKVDFTLPKERFSNADWVLRSEEEMTLLSKLLQTGAPLGKHVNGNFFRGVTTGLNEAFVITQEQRDDLITEHSSSAELIHPARGGEDIRSYFIRDKDCYLIFPRRGTDITKYPAITRHLEQFRKQLTPRNSASATAGRKPGAYQWFEIQDDVAYFQVFHAPKIVFPDICKHPRFCLDESGTYLMNTAYALGTGDKYLLGILNSRLFWFCIGMISIPFGVRAGKFRYRLIYQYMEQIPIRVIDSSKPEDAAREERMKQLVTQMLEAKQQEAAAGNEVKRDFWARKAVVLDRQINVLVYELYGLTPEEIALVEGRVDASIENTVEEVSSDE